MLCETTISFFPITIFHKLVSNLLYTFLQIINKGGEIIKKCKIIISILICAALIFTTTMSISASETGRTLILGGMPFGMKLFSDGVLVVNVDDSYDSPAQKSGIKTNDIIKEANDEKITSNEQLRDIIESSEGKDIELSVFRGKSPISVTLTPEISSDGVYTAGMWIKDSTAGIGTVTYYDERSMSFGALGHGICDTETGMLMPLSKGEIMSATVTGINKAQKGYAGGLVGYMEDEPIGEITVNNDFGIYGRYHQTMDGKRIQTAANDEITTGDAVIISTIDDSGAEEYSVKIETLSLSDVSGKNMIIRVTDSELLEKTGGIIQGMSGSPIIQNNKLVGAVTHVFVNSPQRGYGISIGNMLKNYDESASY